MISSLSFKPPLLLQTHATAKFPLDLKVFAPGSDKRAIYALRYRAFIESQLIAPRDDGLFFDDYDDLETTCTLAAFNGDACVGTFRLTFGQGRPVGTLEEGCPSEVLKPSRPSGATMPCQSIFHDVGGLQAKGYLRLVEFTRLAVAPELNNTSFRTTLYATLVRAGLIVAHAGATDYGLISVNPSQVRFYEMMCGFNVMARAEDYPGITQPAVLMGRDFRALDAKRSKQNPFFRFTGTEVSCARALLFPHAEAEAAVA